MKLLNYFIFLFLVTGVFSANTDCEKIYRLQSSAETNNAALGYVLVIPILKGSPQSSSYYSRQYKKMAELINETKKEIVGPRTIALNKSLKGLLSTQAIHRIVFNSNKEKIFCPKVIQEKKTKGENIQFFLTTYRIFKNQLRLKIDIERVKKGIDPIWTELDDFPEFLFRF